MGPLWLRLYTGVSLLSIVYWLVLVCSLNLVIVELVMHTIDISNCLSYLKDYKFRIKGACDLIILAQITENVL